MQHLPGVQFRPPFAEFRRDGVGQGQVHIVAAKKQVIADREPGEREVATLFADFNEREVGGAAADIGNENEIAHGDFISPMFALAVEPGVERGLRFFEQRQMLEAGGPGRFHGEFARGRIERRGHRQDDLLRFQFVFGDRVRRHRIPGFGEMFQIPCAGFDRRNATVGLGGAERQDRRFAIAAGVPQPRLRTTD